MKIDERFDALNRIRERINAPLSSWTPSAQISHYSDPILEFRLKLRKGIELTLDKVSSTGGLLEHEGEQVVIYIRDHVSRGHATNHRDVRDDPANGKKVHLSECVTIVEMKQKGRFDRYVVTNRRDNLYTVDVLSRTADGTEELDLPLLPCMNCLKELDYQHITNLGHGDRRALAREFDLEEFFETYSTFFSQKPKYRDTTAPSSAYVQQWASISEKVRTQAHWTCSKCRVVLSEPHLRRWLHAHHKNGVKGDNRHSNVVALCLICHSEEPGHEHMHVADTGRAAILKARTKQSR